MSLRKSRIFTLIVFFLFSCHYTNAQGLENAFSAARDMLLLVVGLIIFLIFFKPFRRIKDARKDEKNDSNFDNSDESKN
jgi:hypothetical protein